MKLNFKNTDAYIYLCAFAALIATFWLISLTEIMLSKSYTNHIITTILYKFTNDFWACIVIGIILFPVYLLIHIALKKRASIVLKILLVLLILGQFSLVKYSITTMLNLGADILGYSFDDAFSTVAVSESISITYFLPFIIFPLIFFILFKLFKTRLSGKSLKGFSLIVIILFGSIKLIFSNTSETKNKNKMLFFVSDILEFKSEQRKLSAYNFSERKDYPLLKPYKKSQDVLSPFFNSKDEKPNIVVIVVEGLGSEFVNNDIYSGFTPYIDSIIPQSLNWDNFVSTTGRSFGILPSLFGSLPYGEKGFLEISNTPSHTSLISVLKANGYQTNYYSGGPSSFDRKINFLEYNGIDNLIDENKYGPGYIKTASNDGGFSWGYPDKEIFNKALSSLKIEKQPRLDIVMTLSSHEPFEYPDKESYMAQVDKKLEKLEKPESTKNKISSHKDIFGCLLYTDNAIKGFMNAYAKRPDYDNTIFIITGDHRLIPIEQKDKLCRFHVPFLIYSPLLKKPESFKSVSSHWDVTPSILNFLINNHKFKPLQQTAWMGKGLDTTRHFRNKNKIPLMRYKGSLNDFIYDDYFYSGGELFKINENFGTYKVKEEAIIKAISDSLAKFKKMNAYVTQENRIFPDSLNIYVTPKTKFSKEQLTEIKTYSKGKTFDELLFMARDLAHKKQYDVACLLCDYILNEFPNYTDARVLKGRTLAWEQDYKASESALLNAIKRSPYYDDSYLAILDMYWWSGQEKKSPNIYSQAINNEVINPEISFKMAKAFSRLKDRVRANKLMDSLTKLYADNSEYKKFKRSLK
ncbi:hypothetical protein GCM10023311_12370 [Flaviramulus aquimarinus]|uniref:Sulfatase N-terminal domain-containing protein n=1 Tax=Flaviramulus aquimarinus TaxID=1170456 RepID=A0ABP9EZV8_9FLAO